MEEYNKYILLWSENIKKASEAMKEGSEINYRHHMEEADKAYEMYKKDVALTYECVNFGMANYIFEDALPRLFKTNNKAVKEFISTIKEDKNLRTQFNFYKALENYNKDLDAKEYISESLKLVNDNIDVKTIKESNSKLNKLIHKYGIKPMEFIPEDVKSLYESCDYLFTHKKNLNNLNQYTKNINSIIEYTSANYNKINESKKDFTKLVEEFDKKYSKVLNEEEKSFVKEIMDWKSGDSSNKKEKLFNKFKNECISTVDKLLQEANTDEKDGLLTIKEQILNKMFCEETLVKDIAKLLEIRDVLMDN